MRKNVIKFTAIALLSAFALTACNDDIIAKPKGYGDNSPVVNFTDGWKDDSGHNNLTDIYDSIREGNLPSDTLDLLLYQYATSVFGNYNKITASKISDNKFGDITLKQAVASLEGNKADANAFIKAHRAYWNTDKNGNRVKDDLKTPAGDTDDPTPTEYARLNEKWKTIEKRIAQKMYSNISGGSYSEENVFDEAKYLKSLATSVENNVIALDGTTVTFKGVLTASVEDYDVFVKPSKNIKDQDQFILQRGNYQSSWNKTEAETTDTEDATYIEDKIIPDIYRQLLVEQYLLDKSYDTLGRTSARNISVLAIQKNENYAKGAVNLMRAFTNNYIFDETRDDNLETEADNITLDTFKLVSNAWIGAFMDDADPENNYPDEWTLMTTAVPEYNKASVNSASGSYFQGTAFGDMMEEMDKLSANPNLSENEGTYTGNNEYTTKIGKIIKKRELQLNDYTSTGWYIKSVGVSSLPDSIKTQLFDINVANALKGDQCVEYTYDNTANKWATNENDATIKKGSLINVVGKIKNQYFLRNTTRISGSPVENDIIFEADGKYYIVLVEDAIRSTTMNKNNYTEATDKEKEKLETYINEIVQIVANNDTYKNLSKKHWLEEMNIKYHDTKVYEYFKSNFPELF